MPPRPGLPDPGAVLAEFTFIPRGAGLAAGAAAGARSYRVLRTSEMDSYEPALSLEQFAAMGARLRTAGDAFRGTSRRAAKISISSAAIETFDDLQDLIEFLEAEDDMIQHDPPITRDADSGRVAEEERNIRVRAFIYAASREEDNDFHLIIGRDPDRSPSLYMTMELSGLPLASSPHHAKLKRARDDFKEFFADELPNGSYDFYDPPIPIEVEGSLFFDMSHATGGRPGPASLRDDMPTIWEVHPISKIVFEP